MVKILYVSRPLRWRDLGTRLGQGVHYFFFYWAQTGGEKEEFRSIVLRDESSKDRSGSKILQVKYANSRRGMHNLSVKLFKCFLKVMCKPSLTDNAPTRPFCSYFYSHFPHTLATTRPDE